MTREQANEIKEVVERNGFAVSDFHYYKSGKAILELMCYTDDAVKHGDLTKEQIEERVKGFKDIAFYIAEDFGVSAEIKKLRYQGFINVYDLYVK